MTTANLGMTLPTVGADADAWGGELNTDLGLIDTFAGSLMPGAEVTVASAATADIGAAISTAVAISGTTTITSLGTGTNKIRFVRFTGASLVVTHNATSLINLGAVNRQTSAGDTAIYKSDGSGNWREMAYFRAAAPVIVSFAAVSVAGLTQLATMSSLLPGRWRFSLVVSDGGSAGPAFGQMNINTITASAAGVTFGVNSQAGGYGTQRLNMSIPAYDLTLTAATNMFANGAVDATTGNFYGTFRADPII